MRPPTNHFANGGFHSSTLLQRENQWSAPACSAQNASGSASARSQMRRYSSTLPICAAALNLGGGGKSRSSRRTDSMSEFAICYLQLWTCQDESRSK